MADDRTYIRLHDGMPGHPKIRGLSDKAFRTLVRAWCYCSQYLTDGEVVTAAARDLGTSKAWTELVHAGLVDSIPSGYAMHDYLEHQRSAEEVAELKAGRGAGGTLGNHMRWHVARRMNDPKCQHCNPPDGIANGSQERSVSDSDGTSQVNRSGSHSQRQSQSSSSVTSKGGSHVSNANDPKPPLYSDRCTRHGNDPEPGNCGACKDVRLANAQRPPLALVIAEPWPLHCGKCDETRHLQTPVGVIRCPECHPLAEEAS